MHISKVVLFKEVFLDRYYFLLYINDVTDVFNDDCKCKLMLMISRFTQFWAMLVMVLIYNISWMNCRSGLTGGYIL